MFHVAILVSVPRAGSDEDTTGVVMITGVQCVVGKAVVWGWVLAGKVERTRVEGPKVGVVVGEGFSVGGVSAYNMAMTTLRMWVAAVE